MRTVAIPGWDLEERIGGGGSGEVFRARHRESGEVVALKLGHPCPRSSPEDFAFKLEYSLHSRLRHPHIVRARQFGEIDGDRRYYTMEFVEAVPLTDLFRDTGLEAAAEIALALLAALEYAHSQRILHGDLKPENVLVSVDSAGRPDRILLADFGHARRPGLGTQSEIRGSLAYLAPEQMAGWPLDGRSDLYSLGVTLFEATSGRLPYPVSTPEELLRAYAEFRPPSVLELVPDLDSRWASLVDSLISRNRENRPPSAAAAYRKVAEILERDPDLADVTEETERLLAPTLLHVGRREALDTLARLLRDPGPIRTVVIQGEAGVGKTRLVEEFAQTVELEGGLVRRSDAAEGAAAGFRVLRQVWNEGEVVDLAGPEEVERKESRRPGASARPGSKIRAAELGRLADRFFEGEESRTRERIFLFDSLDRADLDSLAFLGALQGRIAGSRVLLCLVTRTPGEESLHRFLDERFTHTVRLEPLGKDDVATFLAAHLGAGTDDSGTGLPPLDEEEMAELVGWMSRNTGGNPRRMELALRGLVREGHLQRLGPAWRLEARSLPSSMLRRDGSERELERLDGVSMETRSFLETASVAGPEFDVSDVAAWAELDPPTSVDSLAESLLAGVLAADPGGSSRVRFRDPEFARALRESLTEERSRELHLRLAEYLSAPEREEGAAADLAFHLERAGERARAREAYVRAAIRDRDRGAHLEAARHFRKAWELHSARERRKIPEFASDWILALHTNAHFDEAVETIEEILGEAKSGEASRPASASLLLWKGICLAAAGRREEGLECLRALLETGPKIEDPLLEARALLEHGWLRYLVHRDKDARAALVRAREIGLREGDPYTAGTAELRLGILCWRGDDPVTALEWHARAHDHLVEAEGDDLLPAVWGNQAICHWTLLETRKAVRSHRRAAEGFLRLHRRAEATRSYQNLAFVLIEMGHWEEAEETLTTAEHLFRSLRGPREASYFEYCRARLALHRGRYREALDRVDLAIGMASELEDPLVSVGHHSLRGLIELSSGRSSEAGRTAMQCLDSARRIDYRWGIAKSLFLLGRAAGEEKNTNRALEHLDDARRVATDSSQAVLELHIELARAEILAHRGDSQEAHRVLARCQTLLEPAESLFWNALLALTTGKVRARLGTAEKACQSLTDAYDAFAKLGAEHLRAETLSLLAGLRADMGNVSAARAAWRQARVLLEHLDLPLPTPPIPDDLEGRASSAPTVQRVLEAATSVSREVTTAQSVDSALERILDVAITHLGAERGVIALEGEGSRELKVRFARNMDPDPFLDSLEVSRSAISRVGKEGEAIHSRDALADPLLGLKESVQRSRIRSLVSVPIRWGDRVLGAIYMDHRELTDLFGREERLFLQFIADMAAIGIRNAQRFEFAQEQVHILRGELQEETLHFPGTVIGRSKRMRSLIHRGIRAAKAGKVILLTGPSGAGKDHLAKVLHDASGRTGDFVNCPLPTLSETLIESELFGIARGTATQVEPRPGFAEVARGGTLFLNEIGDLPLGLQPILLSFLENRTFRRVGGRELLELDGLIICATNLDLARRTAERAFREDLYYRLMECVLEVPPLRERSEDIPELVDLLLRDLERSAGREGLIVSRRAMDILMECPWDGNIRELKSCLGRAVDSCPSGIIDPQHLESPSLQTTRHPVAVVDTRDVREEMEGVEIRRIHEAMRKTGGIITRSAELLGLTEAALRRRIKRYHLEHLVLHRKPRAKK